MTYEPLCADDTVTGCALCESPGGVPVWQDGRWRVIRAEEHAFPAFYRVIARRHVREFSDLSVAERERCMALVCAIEKTLLEHLAPAKVNLASLGNVVPHLHWHVVARFEWDSRLPDPIWAAPRRENDEDALAALDARMLELDLQLAIVLDESMAD